AGKRKAAQVLEARERRMKVRGVKVINGNPVKAQAANGKTRTGNYKRPRGPESLQAKLAKVMIAAADAGYPLKVELGAKVVDLGTVTALEGWKAKKRDARPA